MYNKLGVREVKKEEIPTPKKPPGKGYKGGTNEAFHSHSN